MPIVVLAGSIAAMVALHLAADAQIQILERDKNEVFVPSYESVKLCSLGFDRFLSDLYWLGFVQYCGDMDARRGDAHRRAYDYMNLITQLDPHFARPYWFGCWAIGYWQKRPDLADKVLQRGIAHNPTSWDLPYLAGVNAYIFGGDAKKAAAYYRTASKLPGAPDYLERHAMILDSPAPAYYKRIHTLYRMMADTKDEQAKEAYRNELVSSLVKLYYTAPTERIRETARTQLSSLNVDVSLLKKPPPIVPLLEGSSAPSKEQQQVTGEHK